jgi:hypothetical protein
VGFIAGTVKVKLGLQNQPISRRVRLFRELDGLLIAEVWSHPTTGAYRFESLRTLDTYTVVSYDYKHDHRAVIADAVLPEIVPLTYAQGGTV